MGIDWDNTSPLAEIAKIQEMIQMEIQVTMKMLASLQNMKKNIDELEVAVKREMGKK